MVSATITSFVIGGECARCHAFVSQDFLREGRDGRLYCSLICLNNRPFYYNLLTMPDCVCVEQNGGYIDSRCPHHGAPHERAKQAWKEMTGEDLP
jgi:hypothetical protein